MSAVEFELAGDQARTGQEGATECWPNVSFGSWLCQNALAEALRRGDFEEVAAFDHFAVFGGFSFLKRSVASAELPWARLQGTNDVSVDYALIAARSGWTPMMFITRVRL